MPTSTSFPAFSSTRRRFVTVGAATLLTAAVGKVPAFAQTPEAASSPSALMNDGFLTEDSVHTVDVTFDQDDYDDMIQTYKNDGDKAWIKATVTIDGDAYEEAGMRLKGNSSLMGLQGGNGMGGGMRGMSGGASVDTPNLLPWLIRLDKYDKEQSHEGMTRLVIRSNSSETSLNEAVALDLLDAAGLASQRAAYTRFTVNGSDAALRLGVELPDDKAWVNRHFSGDGLLYKAESTGDYSYRGDDPESYIDVFDLEVGGSGDANDDFAPLISFLDFINNSGDEAFASELPERLDTDAFATYLAMMDLIQNSDDISGPGNNSYLYVDLESDRFTVVPWDMNLAFNGMFMAGGGMRGGGMTPPANDDFPFDPMDPDATPDAAIMPSFPDSQGFPFGTPDADQARRDQEFPSGTPVADQGGPGGMPNMRGGGGMQRSNPLVERYNAVDTFATALKDRTAELRDELYTGGVASDILAHWVQVLQDGASDLVSSDTVTSESERISGVFTSAS
ncbi:MAG TPA: CotH kinase family protein [Thermomicrobiales bacterium]|nr:CotH kinase family protein [Thermomicrobiales bacterium]